MPRVLLAFGLTAILGGSVAALEGKLPAAVMKKITEGHWDVEFNGTPAQEIVRWLNERKQITITIDPNLAKVEVPKYKCAGKTLLGCAEQLAVDLSAKAFAVGNTIHIAKAPPAAGGVPPVVPAGGGNKSNVPGVFVPGSNASLAWERSGLEACRAARKPIVLYVYDKFVKGAGSLPEYLENTLFADGAVQRVFKDFSCVMFDSSAAGWPRAQLDRAQGGAALILLACDGTPVASWDKLAGRPTPATVSLAAQQAREANAQYVARLVEQEAQAAKKAEEKGAQGEKPKPKVLVPGLAGGDEEKKTPAEETKKEKKKTALVEDEN